MARVLPPGGGPPKGHIKHPRTKKHKHHKHHKQKRHKQKKPHTKKPGTFHEAAGVSANEAGASRDPGDDRVSAAISAGAPQPAREVTAVALGASVDSGLLGAVMTLAGSGDLGGAALATWQREQDRLANRAWRRPGGFQRMGGL